ncbi:unnamed protein product, partial [Polarella glacialis]
EPEVLGLGDLFLGQILAWLLPQNCRPLPAVSPSLQAALRREPVGLDVARGNARVKSEQVAAIARAGCFRVINAWLQQ